MREPSVAPRAIRTRVALATFVLLAVVLAITAVVVDEGVRRAAGKALEARLASEAEALAALTRWDGRRVELEFEDEVMTSFAAPQGGGYFQVFTPAGLVERSHSLRGTALPDPTSADLAPLGMFERRLRWNTVRGPREDRVRMVTLAIARAASSGGDDEPHAGSTRITIVVQVARTLAEADAALGHARKALAIALPLALFLGTAGAFLVARRATAPIARLSLDARSVGTGSLDARIDVARIEGELRELADTLNQAFDRLTAAVERERRFSADTAHELRTPLAVARAALEHAVARERDPGEYREAVRLALVANERLERVVSALLTLTRVDSTALSRERVDLRSAVLEAVDTVKPLAQAANVPIEVSVPDGEVRVDGNAPLLERLVANLLENAVRHGASEHGASVRLHAADGRAELLVLDRGPGFPAELLPRMFERFARGDASRTRETGGAGLGLAIVRAIALAHGGSVDAAAREGGGAEVRVTVPLVT